MSPTTMRLNFEQKLPTHAVTMLCINTKIVKKHMPILIDLPGTLINFSFILDALHWILILNSNILLHWPIKHKEYNLFQR